MTEKTTPELPCTLARDGHIRLILDKSTIGDDLTVAMWDTERRRAVAKVDPAELMRNLAAFVPEVEPVQGDINPGDREHVFTDEGVAMHPSRLKVFRLYGGDRWHVSIDALNSLDDEHDAAITISADEARALGQAFIGAHPPVTAEPATAPSVEQIAEVLGNHERWPTAMADLAREIRALYGTPGDAGEPRFNGKTLREMAHLAADLEERAVQAESMRINLANRVTEVENIARAEVERCKAALEAAEEVIRAQKNLALKSAELRRWYAERDSAHKRHEDAEARYSAARAAVDAETSEEAGA